MIGRPRSNSISTPAARAWSTSVVGEADLRRPVGVAVELLVQLLGLGVELLGLLAQPQLGDLVRARGVQVGGEHLAVAGVRQRGVEHPAGLARRAARRPRRCRRRGRRSRRPAAPGATVPIARSWSTAARWMTPSPISCWARSGSSRIFTRAVTRCLGPAERLRGAVLGQAAVEHRPDRPRGLNWRKCLIRTVRYSFVATKAVGRRAGPAWTFGPLGARTAKRSRARRARWSAAVRARAAAFGGCEGQAPVATRQRAHWTERAQAPGRTASDPRACRRARARLLPAQERHDKTTPGLTLALVPSGRLVGFTRDHRIQADAVVRSARLRPCPGTRRRTEPACSRSPIGGGEPARTRSRACP